MKLAVIAGEMSGDFLGADLVNALRLEMDVAVDVTGVGGPALEAAGLKSLFDFSELSVMGLTAVLARLPRLIRRISETAEAIIDSRPDVLVIIDSPDFTHRVARKVKRALPALPVVNYVCPSVWAWKEERARLMRSYVDLVLAVLPFEPAVMARLGGPKTVYVGHRLARLREVAGARGANEARWTSPDSRERTILIMPGSRASEVSRLLPPFLEAAAILGKRGAYRFLLPAVGPQERRIRAQVKKSGLPVKIITGEAAKWQAFAGADAAIAASGTAILELALSGIPVVSAYKTDWMVWLMLRRIRTWTAALPNLIVDYPAVPEYFNEMVRPGILSRWMERYAADTIERRAALEAFRLAADRMKTDKPSGVIAAEHVARLLAGRR